LDDSDSKNKTAEVCVEVKGLWKILAKKCQWNS